MLRKLALSLAADAQRLRAALALADATRSTLHHTQASPASEFAPRVRPESVAQTLVWFRFTSLLADAGAIDRRAWAWVFPQSEASWKILLLSVGVLDHDNRPQLEILEQLTTGHAPPLTPPEMLLDLFAQAESGRLSTLFEQFLAADNARQRRRQGAFYTPPEVAQRLVEQVDSALRHEFGLAQGLADAAVWGDVLGADAPHADEPFVRILDPAAGAGVFLAAAIDRVHAAVTAAGRAAGLSAAARAQRWNQYVPAQLLPRLYGLELSPAACLAAHLEIAQKLAETGYPFAAPAKVQVYAADTLAAADDGFTTGLPMTVLLGNPPFAALSQNRGPWIDGLLKGQTDDGAPAASYFEVDGRPLGERKHWLHDDYVKFLRYAQWRIESAGCGVIGFVTNHGYLDNPTFRGVRRQLMQAFPRIDVLDLHGNRKKRETAHDGRADENVFEIEQGVALGVFVRPPARPGMERTAENPRAGVEEDGCTRQAEATVRYAELWGTREEKRRTLAAANDQGWEFAPLAPTPPFYFFAPRDESLREEYERGWRLPEVFPVYAAAPVTARDGLVVAFTREELLARIAEFRDLSIPDDTIRERYFAPQRTGRYPRGDTRGWKLAAARRLLADRDDWETAARPCLYRPFDRRWIYWSEAMIDWPRREGMRHLESAGDATSGNVALLARRQMPPTEPCRYFWATDEIALDGVIRSDNRGGESLFPLFLQAAPVNGKAGRRLNLSETFLTAVVTLTGLPRDASTAWTVFHYLYALVHAASYRERYAAHLRIDFPCVFLPRDRALFFALAALGDELLTHHLPQESKERQPAEPARRPRLFHHDAEPPPTLLQPALRTNANDARIAPGFPKHRDEAVFLNRGMTLAPVPAAAWEWRVGGHQVCRKWLKDRKGRVLTNKEIATYGAIVAAAMETSRLTQEVERRIEQHGGWPDAFQGRRDGR